MTVFASSACFTELSCPSDFAAPAGSTREVVAFPDLLRLHGYELIASNAGRTAFVHQQAGEVVVTSVLPPGHSPFDRERALRSIAEDALAGDGAGESGTSGPALLGRLTAREREVLHLLLAGKLTKQVAAELSLSPRTIELYRTRILSKTESVNLAHLARLLACPHCTKAAYQLQP